jgi:hypothetical protein
VWYKPFVEIINNEKSHREDKTLGCQEEKETLRLRDKIGRTSHR